ncbi:hypothetical protein Patl1_16567 [Pistacia atlantica]|uniref:Uncharacterized protein n=1 Tax=Pistacia atlantica TaxID=434234 RepID=A0ACC1BBH3_9ROSI|nr:hypothetical protein Patl1_16567 [Pistacia atlantica]
MLSYIISLITHLRWACEFLFQHSFFSHRTPEVPEIYEEQSMVVRYHRLNSNEGEEECAVCLCKIEGGEEIRELRCDHRFHKVCLDRWVGYKHVTCPLCRDSLASVPPIIEFGMQILTFKKFSSVTSSERESWWLR